MRARIGRAVLDALMDAARERGDREVLLHAQMSAGRSTTGRLRHARSSFEEAGIAHVEMVRSL